MNLVYTADAVADLQRLRAFVAGKNPDAAERIGRDLADRIDGIRALPRLGRPVPAAPDSDTVRDAIFGRYVVRYSLHTNSIVILRIWHHYEDR